MDEEYLRKIRDIMKSSDCPVGCRCHSLKPEKLCKAKRAGLDVLLECLEEHPDDCTFALEFGGSFYCRCKTRMDIANRLGE